MDVLIRVAALLLSLVGCSGEPRNTNLFLDDAPPQGLTAQLPRREAWISETRLAKLNAEHFFDRAFEPDSNVDIVFNLFDDLELRVRAQSYGQVGSGTVVWHGAAAAGSAVRIALAISGRTINGEVRTLDQVVRIIPLDDGWHRIDRYLDSGFPPEAEPLTESSVDRESEAVLPPTCDKPPTGPVPPPNKGPRIRLMVAHTAAAATAAGNMTVVVDLLIDQLAQVWDASPNFIVVPELAHVVQVNYTESGSSQSDLERITGARDGFMDNVHALRNSHKADLVALLVDELDACGRGWLSYPPAAARQSSKGFTVTRVDCALANLTLAHELGHNLGMQHDRHVVGSKPPRTYNYGYSNRNLRLRSIMAYPDWCNSLGISCPRFPSYSHPYPFMKRETIGRPTDTADAAHNRDMLCLASQVVSQYR